MWHKLPPWVLEQLFTWVKHNTDVSSKNGELTRLARVCKSWSLVALNLLWTRCDDLTCLMFTLPMDVLQPSPETGVLGLTRAPEAGELERFVFYSRRVQQLRYHHQHPQTRYRVDPSVLFQVHDSIQDLFPNLQQLYFASRDIKGWDTLHCFVNPHLAHLVLDFRLDFRSGMAGEQVQQHVHAIRDACLGISDVIKGNLRTLVTKTNGENGAALAPVFAELVQRLPKLRKLQAPFGGPALSSSFHQLCRMKDLAAIDIKVYAASFEEVERLHNSMPSNPFQGLRTLHLQSTLSFYQPIISVIHSNTLNSLRLCFREQCPLPTESFNSVIQTSCSATSSLQVFELVIHTPSSLRLQSNLPSAAVLLPLFAHHKLQELVIDLGVPIQLTDADIDTIACMWPKIWRLRLSTAAGDVNSTPVLSMNEGWKPLATSRAIMALFYHLLHLTELAIEFDASTLDELAACDKLTKGNATTPVIRTTKLKVYNVGRSLPGKPLCVASWFAVMCPNLQELQWTGENEGWERTCDLLLRFQEREAMA